MVKTKSAHPALSLKAIYYKQKNIHFETLKITNETHLRRTNQRDIEKHILYGWDFSVNISEERKPTVASYAHVSFDGAIISQGQVNLRAL